MLTKKKVAKRNRRKLWTLRLSKKIVTALLFSLVGFASAGNADSGNASHAGIEQQYSSSRLNVFLSPEFVYISSAGIQAPGIAAGGGAEVAVDSRVAVGAEVRQAFRAESLNPFFGGLDVFATLALTGSISISQRTIRLNDKNVFSSHEVDDGGWRARLIFTRYLFNANDTQSTFLGGGLAILYQIPSVSSFRTSVGLRADLIFNGQVSLLPLQTFLSFSFGLL